MVSQHKAGKGWLAQAFILEAKAHENLSLFRPTSHSCSMAEARGNYPESKEVGLGSSFLTLTLGFPLVHLIPTPMQGGASSMLHLQCLAERQCSKLSAGK